MGIGESISFKRTPKQTGPGQQPPGIDGLSIAVSFVLPAGPQVEVFGRCYFIFDILIILLGSEFERIDGS